MNKVLPVAVGVFVLLWTCFVLWQSTLQTGYGFEQTGQFGDSFGVVSAAMAGLAAFLAYRAFIHGRDQAAQSARSQELRDDELTFFRMMTTRREIVQSFDFSGKHGLSAATTLAADLRKTARDHVTAENWDAWLPGLYKSEVADGEGKEHLWHYFRYTYHILRFVQERFKDPDVAYEYARMLRAELSDAEQLLIALNGLYFAGDQEKKLKPLIETFALLHNIRDGSKVAFGMDQPGAYSEGAFKRIARPAGPTSAVSTSSGSRVGRRGGRVQLKWSFWRKP